MTGFRLERGGGGAPPKTKPKAANLGRSNSTGIYLKAKTSFTRKNPLKKKKVEALAETMNKRERKFAEWEQYASVLNPTIVKPPRTPEELAEAKRMTKLWAFRQMQRERAFQRDEQRLINIKRLAMEEVPEQFKESSQKGDDAILPGNFIKTQITLPLVGEVLFGNCQRFGARSTVDLNGAPPFISRPKKRTIK